VRAAAALLSLLLLAACGGDDGPARAAYVSKAEVICAKADAEQKKLAPPLDVKTFSPYVTKAVGIAERVLRDLEALEAPEDDAKDLEAKVFKPLREQLVVAQAYATEAATATKENDQAALLRLAGNPPTETKADLRWMKSYGFNSCVEAADTSG
jgi:hypothetical protein